MSRFLANLGLLGYIVISAAALLWWAPNFFISNLDRLPELSYRYVTATGVPFGLFLMTVAARQSLLPRFRLGLMLEVFAATLLLSLALYSFYYPPQANFFCAAHLLICGAFTVVNYYTYRRDLQKLDRALAAARA